MFKVILGSFRPLVSKWHVTQKRMTVEQKKIEKVLVGHVWGIFDLLVSKVIWGHPVHLSQNCLYIEMAGRRVSGIRIWDLRGTCATFMGSLRLCSIQCDFWVDWRWPGCGEVIWPGSI